jgi:hypothetical protein
LPGRCRGDPGLPGSPLARGGMGGLLLLAITNLLCGPGASARPHCHRTRRSRRLGRWRPEVHKVAGGLGHARSYGGHQSRAFSANKLLLLPNSLLSCRSWNLILSRMGRGPHLTATRASRHLVSGRVSVDSDQAFACARGRARAASERTDQSLDRHSAKRAYGHIQPVGRRAACAFLTLHDRAIRDEPGVEETPQRDDQLARQRHDRDPPHSTLRLADPGVEPPRQAGRRLIVEPQPRQLDRVMPGPSVAGFTDPLLAAGRAATRVWA